MLRGKTLGKNINTMTELQYEAIKALATSPAAYKAFKFGVRNRKGLDQFMSRIWLSKTTKRHFHKYGTNMRTYDDDFNLIHAGKQIKRDNYSQNLGIEIEYVGGYLDLRKKLVGMGAVEFECGFDGEAGDSKKEKTYRLRECRLRMNGIRSISALYELLSEMKRRNCAHTKRSSTHMHIDCRKIVTAKADAEQPRLELMKEEASKIRVIGDALCLANFEYGEGLTYLNKETIDSIALIFDYNEMDKLNYDQIKSCDCETNYDHVVAFIGENIQISYEFSTIEWRMMAKSFSYSKFILQALVAIHVTNKGRQAANKKGGLILAALNQEYINNIAKIAKELY